MGAQVGEQGAGCPSWLLRLPPEDLEGMSTQTAHAECSRSVRTDPAHCVRPCIHTQPMLCAASLFGGPESQSFCGPLWGFLDSLAQDGNFFQGFQFTFKFWLPVGASLVSLSHRYPWFLHVWASECLHVSLSLGPGLSVVSPGHGGCIPMGGGGMP